MAGKQTAPSTNLAAVDIPAPGTAPNQGIFAFRAGDEIPGAWLDQHADYLQQLTDEGGTKAVTKAPLSEAQNVAADARGAGSPQP